MGRKRLSATVLVAAVVATAGLVGSPAQARPSSQVLQLVRLHNLDRSDRGVPTLRFSAYLSVVARRHSLEMARQSRLYHTPDLARRVRNWHVLGENVGVGPSIPDLNDAFMNSPPHRENILDTSYREIGTGVVIDGDGMYWVTVLFRG